MTWKRGAATVVVGGVSLLVFLAGTLHPVEGLRCRTSEGPSTEDVKRIVQTCLNKITNGGENRSSDEYPNYDSSYTDDSSEEQHRMGEGGKMSGNRRRSSQSNAGDRRMGRPEEGTDRRQMDGRGQRNGEGRNGRPRMEPSQDRGQRDRYDDDNMMMMRDYERQQHQRRKRQYYSGGQGPPMGGGGTGGDFSSSFGHNTPAQQSTAGNGSRSGNSSLERDRACLMQCFFEELKATNAEGFPEKHKVMHVITKDIRERELRDFYIDSIQECFRMLGMDNRLKDKCDYSMRFVTCLTDRFESNCDDWDVDTSAMF